MAVYIYAISSVKYGTVTGTNTMPASGDLTALPDTVKGSTNLEEGEGAIADFYTDQQISPIMSVKTEEGKLTAVMKFYDMTFATLAAIKGGTGDASGYVPPTTYTNILKALQINCATAGYRFLMYNAQLVARITGAGSRDSMFNVEMKATALMTTDLAGSWKVEPIV